MATQTITIASDFSRTPGGRYRSDGKFSGQVFREDILLPKLKAGDVVVYLDGVEGYGSSFLEEAFGGLVRVHKFNESELRRKLRVVAKDAVYARYHDRVWSYIHEAAAAR